MSRGAFLLAALSLILVGCVSQNHASKEEVLLVSLGSVSAEHLDIAVASLEANFNVNVKLVKEDLPKEAYYEPRSRFRADLILDFLDKHFTDSGHVLALTASDVSTTLDGHEDWGILGLGRRPGRSAVVSTFRLKSSDGKLFADRIGKVVLHEFGHTLGLSHCTTSDTCPMQDANGKVATVDKSKDHLCGSCVSAAGSLAQQVVMK